MCKLLSKLKKYLKKKLIGLLKKVSPTYKVVADMKSQVNAIEKKQAAIFWYNQNLPGEPLSETKKRFFRNMPKAEGTVRQVQEIVNEILLEMDNVCRANGIKYWLMGGTLIGAIRHEGFIPWDDDGDVGMMRGDYENFKKAVADNPIIELREFYNFNGCYRIPKIVIRGAYEKLDVDIIVYDYANRGQKTLSEMWAEQSAIRKQCVRAMKRYRIHMMDFTDTKIIWDPQKLAKVDSIVNKYVAKCRYLRNSGDTVIWGVDNFTGVGPVLNRAFKTESIFPLSEMMFEGHSYYVCADYMDMITREYSDIWSLPPDVGTPKYYSEKRLQEMVEVCMNARMNRAATFAEKEDRPQSN